MLNEVRKQPIEQYLTLYLKSCFLGRPCQVSNLQGNFVRIMDDDFFNYNRDNYIILNNKYYNDFKTNKQKYLKYFNNEQLKFYNNYNNYVEKYKKTKYFDYLKKLVKEYTGIKWNKDIEARIKKECYFVSNEIRAVLKESTIDKQGLFNKTLIRDNFDKKNKGVI